MRVPYKAPPLHTDQIQIADFKNLLVQKVFALPDAEHRRRYLLFQSVDIHTADDQHIEAKYFAADDIARAYLVHRAPWVSHIFVIHYTPVPGS